MNKYIFEIGNFGVRWYSLMLLIAAAVGVYLLLKEGLKYKFDSNFLFNLFFWVMVMAFIGARTYYVIFNFYLYEDNLLSIFKIWEGGLAIHGGIIAGFLTMYLYCKKYNAPLFKVTDMSVLPLLVGQAIGRWGNFFNQEAHGAATTYLKLKHAHIPEFIIKNMNIDGTFYTPTFFYESLWCLLGAVIVVFLRHYKYLKVGHLTAFYLMWYSVGRFVIESSRTDSLMLGGLKVAQIVSVLMFITGLLAFMVLSRRSKFENLYSETNANQIKF